MRKRIPRSRWLAAPLVGVLLVVGGCSVNPATGDRQLALMGTQQEIRMGRQADEEVQQSLGLYPDEEMQAYIQELGSRLASRSERPELPWQFRVVDDPMVNAFALPGGFIYVTRGILAHFNSEAELASVLGHEIGHVTARHSVEQMSRAQLATIGLGVAMVASERFRRFGDLAQLGTGLLFLKFSRDDERQSDDLGLRYAVRGGFDPHQMPEVFHTLDRVSAKAGAGRIPVWAATHPNPENRAERISSEIAALPEEQRRGVVNRESYLRRLQGMTFGDNPREGYSIQNAFYHPDLEFRFTFPSGWRIVNQRQAVGAISPQEDAAVVLTLASQDTPAAAADEFFGQSGVERLGGWGQGFSYFKTVSSAQEETFRGLAGFLSHQGKVFRLLGYTAEDRWSTHEGAMQQSLASFRRLTERRHLDVKPKRIELVELPRAMTFSDFARRFPSTVDEPDLAILNAVEAGETLDSGRLMKRVVGGELPAG